MLTLAVADASNLSAMVMSLKVYTRTSTWTSIVDTRTVSMMPLLLELKPIVALGVRSRIGSWHALRDCLYVNPADTKIKSDVWQN